MWDPVQEDMEVFGLLYQAEWTTDGSMEAMLDDRARGRKRKAVRVRCSFCGGSELLEWCHTDRFHGGYGFVHPDEYEAGIGGVCGSGEETLCPFCKVPVKVKKASELQGGSYFVSDDTTAMSADVIGPGRYLVLTGWKIERRVFRDAHTEYAARAAESYVFSAQDCAKLTGWVNSYSGSIGYFRAFKNHWDQPAKWSENWGEVPGGIYGLTPELVERSCLPNCKLDVYMNAFKAQKSKFPVAYLRLYQYHPNVENLVVNGLPMVLDDLLYEEMPRHKWKKNCKGLPAVTEINWEESRPAQMLGLTKEELRMAKGQAWGALFWRLYIGARELGERLTDVDIYNAFRLGEDEVLELLGRGPVGKSLRYLLDQIEKANYTADAYVDMGDYISVRSLLDYWDMAELVDRDLQDPRVRWPKDLLEAHDQVSELGRELEQKELAVLFRIRRKELAKYIFQYRGLKIVPAGSQRDLNLEAEKLDHCVWRYGSGHAKGEYAIFFIRRVKNPKAPYYTLQLDEAELKVKQNRGFKNCEKTPEVQAFEDLWIAWLREGAKRDEKGRPVGLSVTKTEVKTA